MRGWWWLEILATLSNGDGDGDGNEDGKKAIGLEPVYMEVGDPR